jgi:hypothetical protein
MSPEIDLADELRLAGKTARLFAFGNAIELGARHRPMRLSEAETVSYADTREISEIRNAFPHLIGSPLAPAKFVDRTMELTAISDGSFDFCSVRMDTGFECDLTKALQTATRIVRPDGCVFLVSYSEYWSKASAQTSGAFEALTRFGENSAAPLRLEFYRLVKRLAIAALRKLPAIGEAELTLNDLGGHIFISDGGFLRSVPSVNDLNRLVQAGACFSPISEDAKQRVRFGSPVTEADIIRLEARGVLA